MELVLGDLRFAIRGLRKAPLFTTIAIASLGLGIGANTAIFSLFDQVLVRSLGVKEPDRLVQFKSTGANMGLVAGPDTFSYPMYRDLATKNTVFQGVLGRFPTPVSMTFGSQTERADAEMVTGNFFEVLGLHAYLGRLLTPDDDRTPGAHPVTVLGHGYWMRRFGGKADIVNKTISINGIPMTVIGIAPPGFHGVQVGQNPELFVSTMMKAQITPVWNDLFNRRAMWLQLMARLKPGVSREQAEVAMNTLWKPILEDEYKEMPAISERFHKLFVNKHLTLAPGNQGVTAIQERFSKPLEILMGMVGLVLLIACANVANLLLARGAARRQEIAIRLALGAGRWRLIRQLVSEAVILAVAGGFIGIVMSAWFTAGLLRLLPAGDGLLSTLSTVPDARVLAFTCAASMLTGLIFGIAPAFQATRVAVAPSLKQTGTSVVGADNVRWRRWLVAAQVSLSLILLIGAGMFVRSLQNLTSQNVGFNTGRLLTFSMDPKLNGYSQQQTIDFYSRLHDRIQAVPGVQAVTMADVSLLANNTQLMTVFIDGYERKEGEDMNPDVGWVGPGFFSTLGVRVIQGRDFDDRDRTASVAIINEEMARRYFGPSNPIDRTFHFGHSGKIRIIGVASNIKNRNLREKEMPRQVYVSYGADEQLGGMTYYVRSRQDHRTLTASIRRLVEDSQLPMFDVKTMETQMEENVFVDRIIAALSVAFGALATVLAGVGLYGVIAYVVSRRTREIGIRMALGAAWTEVLRLVLTEVAATVGAGVAVALLGAMALGKLVESQLYGVSARDPIAIGVAVGALAVVIFVAALGPSIRALRIEPIRALRYE